MGHMSTHTERTNNPEVDLLPSQAGGEKAARGKETLHSDAAHDEDEGSAPPRDWRFWMVFISILLSVFIAAVDLVSQRTTRAGLAN
jgi:hypothetical protein